MSNECLDINAECLSAWHELSENIKMSGWTYVQIEGATCLKQTTTLYAYSTYLESIWFKWISFSSKVCGDSFCFCKASIKVLAREFAFLFNWLSTVLSSNKFCNNAHISMMSGYSWGTKIAFTRWAREQICNSAALPVLWSHSYFYALLLSAVYLCLLYGNIVFTA